MLPSLARPVHWHLFAAEALSLLGTGIAAVAPSVRDGDRRQEERGASG